jgi:GTP cyclohydrolase II
MRSLHDTKGPGVIIFLEHDGRGRGAFGLLKDLNERFLWSEGKIVCAHPNDPSSSNDLCLANDQRDYGVVRRIVNLLGIQNPQYLTENKEKQRQLAADYVESIKPIDKDIELYNRLQAEKIIRHANKEWERLWETVDENKKLLQAEGCPLFHKLGQAPLPTKYGDWTLAAYGDYTSGEVHYALAFGELRDCLDGKELYPVRLHSSCLTNERFHATNCECRLELHETMDRIQKAGKGVIVYLQQEGRGTGVFGKLHQLNAMFSHEDGVVKRNRNEQGALITTVEAYEAHGFPPEARDFEVAAQILSDLGVCRVALQSNNPTKAAGLTSRGIEVTCLDPLIFLEEVRQSELLRDELFNKFDKLGHEGLRNLFESTSPPGHP